MTETVEKDHGLTGNMRLLRLRLQLACLYKPEQWPDLEILAVIESRCIRARHPSSAASSSAAWHRMPTGWRAIQAHWSIENRLHWCMDVAFADDQMCARSGHAAHNLAILKHITLNLIRL